MVYTFCVECSSRHCGNESSHRAQGFHKYRADFTLGGRSGQRIRINFDRKQDAVDYEDISQADFKRGLFIPKKSKILFSELADKYYQEHYLHNQRHTDRSTIYRINEAKNLFKNQIAESITRQQAHEIRLELRKKWSGATVNRFINGVLKPIFNKGIDWDLISKNPFKNLEKMTENDPIPRFLSLQEIEQLYNCFHYQHLKDFADIILHTGARPSSIKACSFDSGDVNTQSKTIWFTTYKGRRKYRYSHPIDSVLANLIERRIKETGGKGKVFDTANVDKLARQAVKESKINEGRSADQFFTIYGLKHCYVSHLLMSGASLYDVAKLLGHTDVKMLIKHYGHLTQEYLRDVQAKINLTPTTDLKVI